MLARERRWVEHLVLCDYNAECMKRWGCQAVVVQTTFSSVIGWDPIEHGQLMLTGMLGPKAFDPKPFIAKMAEYEFPHGMFEMSV